MQTMQETFELKLKKMKQKNKQLFKKAIEEHLQNGTTEALDQDSSLEIATTPLEEQPPNIA